MRKSSVVAVASIACLAALACALHARGPAATAAVVTQAPAQGAPVVAADTRAPSPAVAPAGVAKSAAVTTVTGASLEPSIVARLDQIETAVREGDVRSLPALAASDLAKEPEAAPAIIHALASLAVQGTARDHELAGKTLARWLREESKRDTRDASGNVVNIVEALGDLGGDAAVTALIDALDHEGTLDLALQTTTAERLGALGDPRARAAVDRFAARVAKLPRAEDAFERELQDEAAAAAAQASARLSH